MKLSIIITVYNLENYIEKLFNSLIPQLKNFNENVEVLVINDGSTDNSLKIIEMANEKKIFKVISQSNSGVSSARNNGIKQSCGEYITFLDGDDFIEKSYLKTIMDNLKSNRDIYIYPFYYFKNDQKKLSYIPEKDVWLKSERSDKVLYNLIYKHREIHSVPWNKVYKKEIIISKNIFFENKKFFEDIFFNLEYFYYVETIGFINNPIVNYVQRNGSITKSYDEQIFDSQKNITNKLIKFTEKNNIGAVSRELFEVFDIRLSLYTYLYLFRQNAEPTVKRKYKENIKKKILQYHAIDVNKLILKHKLLLLFIKISR